MKDNKIEIITFTTNSGKVLVQTQVSQPLDEEPMQFYKMSGESNGSYGINYCITFFNVHTIYCKSRNILLKVGDRIIGDNGKKLKIYGIIVDKDLNNPWIATNDDFTDGLSLQYYLISTYEVSYNPLLLTEIKWGNLIERKEESTYFIGYESALREFNNKN
jgi:hypothetical protein